MGLQARWLFSILDISSEFAVKWGKLASHKYI